MRRLRLATLLVLAVNGLVLAAVTIVAMGAARHLKTLSDEQALARTRFAAEAAAAEIAETADETAVAARVLAGSPSLAHAAAASEMAGVSAFLETFRRTSRLSGVALLRRDHPLVAHGVLADARGAGIRMPASSEPAIFPQPDGPLLVVAGAPVPSSDGTRILVCRALDDDFARGLESMAGVPVLILEARHALSGADDPRAFLRARALSGDQAAAERVVETAEYLAVRPLRAPSGEVVGLIEARMPTAGVDAALRQLRLRILGLALLAAAAATLCGALLGRRLARPLRDLTDASARIGRGDLGTPIPRAPGAETGRLAATMDDMRGRLLHLTAELQRRRSDAEAILSGIVEGVFSVDRERRIRYLNPQAAAMLGVAADDAVGRFCGEVLHPLASRGERPCETACPILHARFSGTARAAETVRTAFGAEKTLIVTSAAPGAGNGAHGGAESAAAHQFQVVRDETELEAARRARDAVLANISHEFRTPLAAQLASIELLRDRLPELSPAEGRELVLSLERGTIRLTRLIDNLLESVRIESGRSSIRRQSIALDEVVEEAVQMMAPLIEQRHQSLSVDLPWPLPPVMGDGARLAQVLVNLLANANKFAHEGSTIRIGASGVAEAASANASGPADRGIVRFWVEDEGPGLPAGSADLFAPFSRSEGEEPEASGLGLGLFIARSIVERHGGRIETGPGSGGRGTRVTVVLPAGGADAQPHGAQRPGPAEAVS